MTAWPGTQSLLSMWFHDELVPAVTAYGLDRPVPRVDGAARPRSAAGLKAGHLAEHLAALGVEPATTRC